MTYLAFQNLWQQKFLAGADSDQRGAGHGADHPAQWVRGRRLPAGHRLSRLYARRLHHGGGERQESTGDVELPFSPHYDVVIVGASFAGLATAMQLRDYRVLLVDQYPIGSHQMSACGTPFAIAKAMGAEAAIQEVHDALVLHTAGQTIRFPLRDPYVTFDYKVFCQAMLKQTSADVQQVRATGYEHHCVMTACDPIPARFIVDAAGWQSPANCKAPTDTRIQVAGYGLETELPLRLEHLSGLHFYFEKAVVRNGYAWVFPCGATTRFGIGSFDPGVKLRPLLAQFLSRFGLAIGATHGGVLAIAQHDPFEAGIFRVGDAAGHCLPVTGEGIRTAIYHGIHCGRALARVLAGRLSPEEALSLYQMQVHCWDQFRRRLLQLQTLIAHTPEPILALAGRICSRPALTHWIMNRYLGNSGWFVG